MDAFWKQFRRKKSDQIHYQDDYFPLANQSFGPMDKPPALPLPLVVPAQGLDQNGCSYNAFSSGWRYASPPA